MVKPNHAVPSRSKRIRRGVTLSGRWYKVKRGLDRSAGRLGSLFREGYRDYAGDRKRFAVEFAARHKDAAPFLFALWPKGEADDATVLASARALVVDYVRRNLGSATRVAQVRHFFGDDTCWRAEIPDLDA